jgi:hypothetical protein
MKSINILIATTLLLSTTACKAQQIKNAKTETVQIYGNCGMCKSTIEKAGNDKKTATVNWNKDSKMATLTFDSTKTNKSEILKRIALSGYDNDEFLAPNDAYSGLHGCCQYDRKMASDEHMNNAATEANVSNPQNHNHGHADDNMAQQTITDTMAAQGMAQLYQNYFKLKDAFVKSNQKSIMNYSGSLYRTIKSIDMNTLEHSVHIVWMKKMKDLEQDASAIANEKNIEKQRSYLNRLSNNVYELMKAGKPNAAVYFDHCPMANGGKGANWLSQEKEIKNPYYGDAMLSCGKTLETIK